MNKKALFTSKSDEWATPQHIFDSLNAEFGFDLDPCSDGNNAKCKNHYTIIDDGLSKDWGTSTVFMNPPYSRVADWIAKAWNAAQGGQQWFASYPQGQTHDGGIGIA